MDLKDNHKSQGLIQQQVVDVSQQLIAMLTHFTKQTKQMFVVIIKIQ